MGNTLGGSLILQPNQFLKALKIGRVDLACLVGFFCLCACEKLMLELSFYSFF